MLRDLFKKQKELITDFFEKLDMEKVEAFFLELQKVGGVLFVTGIGKSGIISQKIAATLMSTGTRSYFLSPIDALHGDLGMVSNEDAVLILSKSGETEELLHLVPHIRNKGAKIFAITSNAKSRLSSASDYPIELPCDAELCPFDLAPTISTTAQLLFGDLLAIALMKKNGFSARDFTQNHPGGFLGKRSHLRVRDIMLQSEKTPLSLPTRSLREVLVEFTEKRCGCMVIVDENSNLKGIFTDGDLRRALQAKGEKVLDEKLGNLMTDCPRAICEGDLAFNALKVMESDQKKPIMVLPVLNEENKVVGLIKMHDLIQAGL